MGTSQMLLAALVALAVGLSLGAIVVWKMMAARMDAAMRRSEAHTRDKINQVTDKLRADLTRAQTVLAERTALQAKELAAAASEPKAVITKLEQQLEMAYAELDRMRTELYPPRSENARRGKEDFAQTQPMMSRL